MSNAAAKSKQNSTVRRKRTSGSYPVAPKAKSKKPTPQKADDMGIVDQVKLATKLKNLPATLIGFVLGGYVPFAVYDIAHNAIDRSATLYSQLNSYIVLGGLCFSALTVFAWAKMAFQNRLKALGFVVILEGVLTFVNDRPHLTTAALVLLVCINAVAAGCNLSLRRVA